MSSVQPDEFCFSWIELESTLAAPLDYVLEACFKSCYGLMEIVHIHIVQNTAHRPSTQASYTTSWVRPKSKISCAAAQIAATLTISFRQWRHTSLTSHWGQQRMSLTSYPPRTYLNILYNDEWLRNLIHLLISTASLIKKYILFNGLFQLGSCCSGKFPPERQWRKSSSDEETVCCVPESVSILFYS